MKWPVVYIVKPILFRGEFISNVLVEYMIRINLHVPAGASESGRISALLFGFNGLQICTYLTAQRSQVTSIRIGKLS